MTFQFALGKGWEEGALWSRESVGSRCNRNIVQLFTCPFARFTQEGRGPDDISSPFLPKSMSGLMTFELALDGTHVGRTTGANRRKMN